MFVGTTIASFNHCQDENTVSKYFFWNSYQVRKKILQYGVEEILCFALSARCPNLWNNIWAWKPLSEEELAFIVLLVQNVKNFKL